MRRKHVFSTLAVCRQLHNHNHHQFSWCLSNIDCLVTNELKGAERKSRMMNALWWHSKSFLKDLQLTLPNLFSMHAIRAKPMAWALLSSLASTERHSRQSFAQSRVDNVINPVSLRLLIYSSVHSAASVCVPEISEPVLTSTTMVRYISQANP